MSKEEGWHHLAYFNGDDEYFVTMWEAFCNLNNQYDNLDPQKQLDEDMDEIYQEADEYYSYEYVDIQPQSDHVSMFQRYVGMVCMFNDINNYYVNIAADPQPYFNHVYDCKIGVCPQNCKSYKLKFGDDATLICEEYIFDQYIYNLRIRRLPNLSLITNIPLHAHIHRVDTYRIFKVFHYNNFIYVIDCYIDGTPLRWFRYTFCGVDIEDIKAVVDGPDPIIVAKGSKKAIYVIGNKSSIIYYDDRLMSVKCDESEIRILTTYRKVLYVNLYRHTEKGLYLQSHKTDTIDPGSHFKAVEGDIFWAAFDHNSVLIKGINYVLQYKGGILSTLVNNIPRLIHNHFGVNVFTYKRRTYIWLWYPDSIEVYAKPQSYTTFTRLYTLQIENASSLNRQHMQIIDITTGIEHINPLLPPVLAELVEEYII